MATSIEGAAFRPSCQTKQRRSLPSMSGKHPPCSTLPRVVGDVRVHRIERCAPPNSEVNRRCRVQSVSVIKPIDCHAPHTHRDSECVMISTARPVVRETHKSVNESGDRPKEVRRPSDFHSRHTPLPPYLDNTRNRIPEREGAVDLATSRDMSAVALRRNDGEMIRILVAGRMAHRCMVAKQAPIARSVPLLKNDRVRNHGTGRDQLDEEDSCLSNDEEGPARSVSGRNGQPNRRESNTSVGSPPIDKENFGYLTTTLTQICLPMILGSTESRHGSVRDRQIGTADDMAQSDLPELSTATERSDLLESRARPTHTTITSTSIGQSRVRRGLPSKQHHPGQGVGVRTSPTRSSQGRDRLQCTHDSPSQAGSRISATHPSSSLLKPLILEGRVVDSHDDAKDASAHQVSTSSCSGSSMISRVGGDDEDDVTKVRVLCLLYQLKY